MAQPELQPELEPRLGMIDPDVDPAARLQRPADRLHHLVGVFELVIDVHHDDQVELPCRQLRVVERPSREAVEADDDNVVRRLGAGLRAAQERNQHSTEDQQPAQSTLHVKNLKGRRENKRGWEAAD